MKLQLAGLWRNADFLKLWSGQTISEIGSHITRDGLPLLAVMTLGATPAQMGLLSALGAAPILVLSLFAGAWVDRLPRRPIMIAADLGRAVLLLTIPAAAVAGRLSLGQILVVSGLSGILTVFFDIAYQAYLPTLVERDHIVEGNSKLALSSSAAEITGPGLTGFLVQALTAPIAILLDALSFLVSVASLVLIRKPEPRFAPAPERQDLRREIVEGLAAVSNHSILRALAASAATRSFLGNFFGPLYALYALRELQLGPAALGLTIAMGGVGDLVAALVAEPAARRLGLGRLFIGALILETCMALFIPLAREPLIVAVLMLMAAQLFGDSLSTIFRINEISLRQSITPDRLLGRVNASVNLLVEGTGPLGALAGGVLGGLIGLRPTLTIAAMGGLVGCLWLVFSPVRQLRDIESARKGKGTE